MWFNSQYCDVSTVVKGNHVNDIGQLYWLIFIEKIRPFYMTALNGTPAGSLDYPPDFGNWYPATPRFSSTCYKAYWYEYAAFSQFPQLIYSPLYRWGVFFQAHYHLCVKKGETVFLPGKIRFPAAVDWRKAGLCRYFHSGWRHVHCGWPSIPALFVLHHSSLKYFQFLCKSTRFLLKTPFPHWLPIPWLNLRTLICTATVI